VVRKKSVKRADLPELRAAAGPEYVVLAYIVVECAGSKAGSQRLLAFLSLCEAGVKEIHKRVISGEVMGCEDYK